MKYDVTVVGAGPAGSTTAKFLSEKGFKTLLIDKERFPRDKPCGGGLPLRVLQRFPYVVNEKIIEAYSSSGTLFSPSLGHRIEIERETPILSTILRKKFDFELVNYAKDAGAVFQQGTPVSSVRISDDSTRILLHDGTAVESEIVVGADGVNSCIAKKTGLRKRGMEKGVCILQEFDVDEKIMDEYFTQSRHCYIHSRFKTVAGYGWVFPKKHHLNIGFGVIQAFKTIEKKQNLLECYYDYIALLKEKDLIPQDLMDAPVQGGALPTHPLEKTYGKRLLLVGDAAGFINPLSGEGIYYAMASGQIAAEVLGEALEKNQTTEEFLARYQNRWRKDFGKDIGLILKVVKRGSVEYAEKLFTIARKDEKLTNLLMGVIVGEFSVQQYKWKIMRRFFYSSLKYRLHI
ncbi:MAG: geranylgeranyl reductase family protein [Candidatus Thermoplasmatota archaeon]|nr:geranylgeranyl reductase family protein [Candidatus Thermoplasmatota archaeon]